MNRLLLLSLLITGAAGFAAAGGEAPDTAVRTLVAPVDKDAARALHAAFDKIPAEQRRDIDPKLLRLLPPALLEGKPFDEAESTQYDLLGPVLARIDLKEPPKDAEAWNAAFVAAVGAVDTAVKDVARKKVQADLSESRRLAVLAFAYLDQTRVDELARQAAELEQAGMRRAAEKARSISVAEFLASAGADSSSGGPSAVVAPTAAKSADKPWTERLPRVDGVAADLGYGNSRTTVRRLAVTQNWNKERPTGEGWKFDGYWEASAGTWENNDKSVTDLGITPVFRWVRGMLYAEAAIGAHYVEKQISAHRNFSTRFQFGDHLGAGVQAGNWDLGMRLQHLSNGGIRQPNPGINFLMLRALYNLK